MHKQNLVVPAHFSPQIEKLTAPTGIVYIAFGHRSEGGPSRVLDTQVRCVYRRDDVWYFMYEDDVTADMQFVEMLGHTNIPLYHNDAVREYFRKMRNDT